METNRRFYSDSRTEVETAEGIVRGCFLNDHYYFRGIPYATAERFKAPRPMEHWDGVLEAVTYGPVAPTISKPSVSRMYALTQQPLFGYRFWPEDEQCQYVNVWTKELTPGRKRPVMVWVHGGGFGTGSSVEQMSYDGANLCRDGDLVVVSFNHRLNILGYMDFSEFGEEYWNSGNAGMEDIVEVLHWIRRNIERFGGDPDNVTLFGQSGGGGKIRTLMQIPEADGLYHKAIFQSGLMNLPGEVEDAANNRRVCRAMVEKLGLTKETFPEIANVPFEKLNEVYQESVKVLADEGVNLHGIIQPVRNSYYVGNPNEVGLTDYAKKVPVMGGTCQCETVLYVPKYYPYDTSPEKKDELLTYLFGDNKEKMIELFRSVYPDGDLLDLYNLDFIVRKGVYEFFDRKAECEAPVYCYMITYHLNYFGGVPAYHGFCLPLVFGNTEYVDACNEPDCVALSQKMHQAWINFATCGDPNGGDVPEWEPYRKGECGTMIFDRQCGMRYDFDRELVWKFQESTDLEFNFMRVKKNRNN